MEKGGQFYLVAILIIVSLLIGIITIENAAFIQKKSPMKEMNKELENEKRLTLDFISKNNLNLTDSNKILENFSMEYSNFLGDSKSSLFVWGPFFIEKTSSLNYVLNNLNPGEEYILEVSGINQTLNTQGTININENSFKIYISGFKYVFNLNEGQNIYYLIKYDYDGERYIIYG